MCNKMPTGDDKAIAKNGRYVPLACKIAKSPALCSRTVRNTASRTPAPPCTAPSTSPPGMGCCGMEAHSTKQTDMWQRTNAGGHCLVLMSLQ